MSKPVVRIKNIVKHYGKFKALDGLDIEVNDGEIFGLLGPNGSGKTTCMNCMLSLLSFDSGEVEIFGEKMAPDRYDVKRNIGVVPQDVAVFNDFSVRENIDYFCGLYVKNREQERIRQYEFENFIFCYKAYKKLGGNSFIDHIKKEIESWEVIT